MTNDKNSSDVIEELIKKTNNKLIKNTYKKINIYKYYDKFIEELEQVNNDYHILVLDNDSSNLLDTLIFYESKNYSRLIEFSINRLDNLFLILHIK